VMRLPIAQGHQQVGGQLWGGWVAAAHHQEAHQICQASSCRRAEAQLE